MTTQQTLTYDDCSAPIQRATRAALEALDIGPGTWQTKLMRDRIADAITRELLAYAEYAAEMVDEHGPESTKGKHWQHEYDQAISQANVE